MKNYIIFYAAIIAFIIGGIKWTSYVIEKEKEAELAKTNFHQQLTGVLARGGEVNPAETRNKNIVFTSGLVDFDAANSKIPEFNELSKKYAANTVFYVSAFADKERVDSKYEKLKVTPAFKTISKEWMELYKYFNSLSHYFYTGEDLNEIRMRNYRVLVINPEGKILMYKMGSDKDIISQIETVLNK